MKSSTVLPDIEKTERRSAATYLRESCQLDDAFLRRGSNPHISTQMKEFAAVLLGVEGMALESDCSSWIGADRSARRRGAAGLFFALYPLSYPASEIAGTGLEPATSS